MKKIVNISENFNINIALENLRKSEYLDYILQEISSPKLGFCYDSGHNNCFTPERDFLKCYGYKLFALHLHDNDGIDDLHMIPFDGNIKWNTIKNELDNINYEGAISLEIEQGNHGKYKNMSPEEFLRKAFISASKF